MTVHPPHINAPHAPHAPGGVHPPGGGSHPPHAPGGSHPPVSGSHPPPAGGSHPPGSGSPHSPPGGGSNSLLLGGGLGLLGVGGAFLPGLINAGRDVGLAGIAGNVIEDVAQTVMDGLSNIIGDIGSNPMALGAIVASVAVVAYMGMKK